MIAVSSKTVIFAAMQLPRKALEQRFRMVVRASSDRRKQFVWEIHDHQDLGASIETSQQAYRTMEEAYTAGKAVLETLKHKVQPANAPDGVSAQPAPARSTALAPQGALTSQIYRRG